MGEQTEREPSAVTVTREEVENVVRGLSAAQWDLDINRFAAFLGIERRSDGQYDRGVQKRCEAFHQAVYFLLVLGIDDLTKLSNYTPPTS